MAVMNGGYDREGYCAGGRVDFQSWHRHN